jgi:hypothetical protein
MFISTQTCIAKYVGLLMKSTFVEVAAHYIGPALHFPVPLRPSTSTFPGSEDLFATVVIVLLVDSRPATASGEELRASETAVRASYYSKNSPLYCIHNVYGVLVNSREEGSRKS